MQAFPRVRSGNFHYFVKCIRHKSDRILTPVKGWRFIKDGLQKFARHYHLETPQFAYFAFQSKRQYSDSSTTRRYVSRLFQNFSQVQPVELDSACRSHKLMMYNEVVAACHPGGFYLLPLGQRAMDKLIRIIDLEMEAIGGQKISMPSLAPANLWKQTGRWELTGQELFTLKDRHKQVYCLGPTHEELVTCLFASTQPISYRRLPQLIYQISRKFRDEMAPKHGLLRGREFEMKDMYTFDADEESAMRTYQQVCDAYSRIFDRLGVNYVKVQGSTGNIGGSLSHEFHYLATVGEDKLVLCSECGLQVNKEVKGGSPQSQWCRRQDTECKLREVAGIEVGHSFYLGTKYSSVFNATYTDLSQNVRITHMCCFGLGVTRILQAALEVLSTEKQLRWPALIAPYQICIIPQKEGYAADTVFTLAEEISDELSKLPNLHGEIVIDDRTQFTIGRRLYEASRLGYPYILILGKKALEVPWMVEVTKTSSGETTFMSHDQLLDLMSSVRTI